MNVFRTRSSIDDIVISYLVIPILLVGIHGLINLGWLGERSDELSVLSFIMLIVVSYEVGVKRYYAKGRRSYFYIVFVAPMMLSAVSIVSWFASR